MARTPSARSSRPGAPAAGRRAATSAVAEGAGLLMAVPLWWWWAADRGGYPQTRWLVGVVWLAAVLALLAWTGTPRPPLTRARRTALVALAAVAVWALSSVAWADDRGSAWAGGLRWSLLALGAAGPLLWPPSPRALRVGVAAGVFGGVIALVAGLAAAYGGDALALDDGRLAAPAEYPNATATLLLAAGFSGLLASSAARRTVAAALLGAAGGALTTAVVLTQSRGGVGAAVLLAVASAAVVPSRGRFLAALAATGTMTAAGWPALTDVRRVVIARGDVDGALDQAVLVLLAAAVLTGAVAAAASRRRAWSVASGGWWPPRVLAALAAGAVAVAIVLVVTDPGDALGRRWRSFKTPDYAALEASRSRFTGNLGSNRFDYWRVASATAREHPLLGVGAENFAAAYLADRRSAMTPRYAHDLWLEVGATLGLPALLALLAAVAALAAAALRRRATWGLAALAPGAVALVEGSADWTTMFPAAALPAVGLAAAASVAAGRASAEALPGAATQGFAAPSSALRAATAVGLAAAVALAGPLWLSARWIDRAAGEPRLAAATADLDRAADWDPLGSRAPLALAIRRLDAGDLAGARASFAEAARRDPSAWFAPVVLGLLDARDGDRAAALRGIDAAIARNPREPRLRAARDAVRRGRPPDPRATARDLLSPPR